ncbi:helix-turn-helix domain-containing protein, partial [Proteus mirabilis]|uniref:helix-turn-helix domain-containing protein n=1 Tax=Proteus mirabilis TaxID=584 RepID=UPI0013D4C691
VEIARVEAARRMLEDGHDMPKQVAARCGFADVDVLRRAFRRRVGVTPTDYRRRHDRGAADDALAPRDANGRNAS